MLLSNTSILLAVARSQLTSRENTSEQASVKKNRNGITHQILADVCVFFFKRFTSGLNSDKDRYTSHDTEFSCIFIRRKSKFIDCVRRRSRRTNLRDVERDNGDVHRAAAKIIVSKSRAARGSVCNVLLSRDLPWWGPTRFDFLRLWTVC